MLHALSYALRAEQALDFGEWPQSLNLLNSLREHGSEADVWVAPLERLREVVDVVGKGLWQPNPFDVVSTDQLEGHCNVLGCITAMFKLKFSVADLLNS